MTAEPFAVWITGLPASGKSTLAAELRRELARRGVEVEVLESDELRRVLTPHATYREEDRDAFYGAMVHIAGLLVRHGVNVILDATANLRRYRERARAALPRFAEVYLDCPVEVCAARDPKGLYRQAREGRVTSLPGVQAPFEPPERPEFVVKGTEEPPEAAARRIAEALAARPEPATSPLRRS